MENPADRKERALELAREWNNALARRVTRWKRLRLAIAVLLTGVGIATTFSTVAWAWSVPCFLAAFIAYLLYLDSRDQVREIRSRSWATITPRISRLKERTRKAAAKASSPP